MKKSFSLVSVRLMLAFSVASFIVSCGDDPVTPGKPGGGDSGGQKPDTTVTPDVPDASAVGKVTKIVCRSWEGTQYDDDYTVELFYDQKGRVARMVQTEVDEYDKPSGESGTVTVKAEVTLTYGNGTASYSVTYSEDGVLNPDQWVKGSATLDAFGRVVRGEYTEMDDDDDNDNEEYRSTYTLTYDANGYLVKSEGMDGDDPLSETLTWTSGNLTQVNWGRDNGRDLIDKAVYGQVENIANVDLNYFLVLDSEGFDFSAGDPLKIFAMLGMVGNRSTHMATKVTEAWGDVKTYTYESIVKGKVTKIVQLEQEGSHTEREEFEITYSE